MAGRAIYVADHREQQFMGNGYFGDKSFVFSPHVLNI
jgi:hypothetical protein